MARRFQRATLFTTQIRLWLDVAAVLIAQHDDQFSPIPGLDCTAPGTLWIYFWRSLAWRGWRWVETVMIAEMAPHLLAEIRAVLHTESQR